MAFSHHVKRDTGHPRKNPERGTLAPVWRGLYMAKEKRPEAYSVMQTAIGKRIQWARELVEPNRAALARDMGIDRTTLQKVEDGDRAPSIFLVVELAHRLRVSTDYILLGTLRGVDGELAARLLAAHPELHEHNRMAMAVGIVEPPRRRGRQT